MSGRRLFSWRLFLLALVFAAGGVGLVGRLVYLQILNHERYALQAADEHTSRITVRAPRGAILDRHGYPLATSVDAFDVLIERKTWHDQSGAAEWAETLAPLTGHSPQEILEGVQAEAEGDYLLALGLDYDVGQRLGGLGIPGIKTVPTGKRFYPEGDLASALLGFVGRDQIGPAGLEVGLQA